MSNKINGFETVKGNDFQEVSIPVPWGHISGKWWGSRDKQPIVAIHGWQDNAGTYDTLAPLLAARGHSLLCIDLPGHGLSSHYATGHYYYIFWDGVHIIRRIANHFNWSKINIMGHSLGGGIGFLYSSVFPDDVQKYISLDIASPSVRKVKNMLDVLPNSVDKFLKYENLSEDQVPCYQYSEMLDVVYDAYKGGVTRSSCAVMMRRGMRPAEDKPGHYVFNRDPRLKVAALGFMCQEQVLEMAGRIKCEVLNIKAKQGFKFDYPEFYTKILDVIEEAGAKKMEREEVEGTHHVHINNPERVVDIIDKFLKS